MKLLEQIDMAICLTLDKRLEMYKELKEKVAQYFYLEYFLAGDGSTTTYEYDYIDDDFLPVEYVHSTTYPTWWKYPHAFNAWKCHQKIIEKFLQTPAQTLLIMEDDAQLEPDFEEVIQELGHFFSTRPWDMVYFGAYHNKNTLIQTSTPNIVRVNGCAGFHAVLMRRQVATSMYNWRPLGPMDWMCGKYIHPVRICYGIFPSIITQRSGYSYIEEGYLEKTRDGNL